MSFPPGKFVALMLLISGLSGAMILRRPPAPHARQTLWVFDGEEADTLADPAVRQAQNREGVRDVDVQLLTLRGLDLRLLSLLLATRDPARLPSVVEIEIGSIGKYLRPPLPDIGLLPLNDFLDRTGLRSQFLPARLSPWTKNGIIFGLPLDVHPVSLTYRRDLCEQAGIDLDACDTWAQLREAALRYQQFWSDHGQPGRRFLQAQTTQADMLRVLLLQQHLNMVDASGALHLNDPRTARTLAFYARLALEVGVNTPPREATACRDLADGTVCAALTPDWRIATIKAFAPDLAGKLRMRPLPRFESSDAPTATWGGTMVGIPRDTPDLPRALELLKFIATDPTVLAARLQRTSVIPPLPALWRQTAIDQPDPFFGGESINAMYIGLAAQAPREIITAQSHDAQMALAILLYRSRQYLADHPDGVGLEEACQGWLDRIQEQVSTWAARERFE